MIDKKIVQPLLGKLVGIVYADADRKTYSKGTIKEISDSCLVLSFRGRDIVLSFNCIEKIREMRIDSHDGV